MYNRRNIHGIFWLAYLLIYGYLATPFFSLSALPMWERLARGFGAILVVIPLNLMFVYCYLEYLVPLYPNKKRIVGLGFIFTFVMVALYRLVMDYIVSPHFYLKDLSRLPDIPIRYVGEWLYGILNLLSPLAILGALDLLVARIEAAEREKNLAREKLESELHFLRVQTNPHFLFNTLNNIYHLARKQSPETPDIILRLSSLLRYMLYECSASRAQISKEIAVLDDYIALEELRYNNRLELTFDKEVDDEGTMIPPLLLLPLVENCFKHGASESSGSTFIRLVLRVRGGILAFVAENSCEASEVQSEGIGLRNLHRQLELLFSEYVFFTEQRRDRYYAELRIDLSKSINTP